MAANIASTAPRTRARNDRSSSMASNREVNALIGQVLERLDDMSKKIEAMLPREIYEVRHGQVVSDTQELMQRVGITEKAINELSSQLTTARLAASQQITSEVRPVEKSLADVRYEAQARLFELFNRTVFFLGGALVTIGSYIVFHH